MAPQSPTTQAVFASSASTLKRCFSDGMALRCACHVAPPSAVWRIDEDFPTAQPCVPSAKSTPKSGFFVPLSRDCQVFPASLVW